MGFIGAAAVKLKPAADTSQTQSQTQTHTQTQSQTQTQTAVSRPHPLRPYLVTLLQPLVRAIEARSTSSEHVRSCQSYPSFHSLGCTQNMFAGLGTLP